MKQFKVFVAILLVSGLLFSAVACSPEKIINKITDGKIDIDKDGTVNIKDGDKEIEVGGTSKWDSSKMHGLDAPKGKLDSFLTSEDGTMYGFSDMKEKDAKDYIQKLKDEGFTYNSVVFDEYIYSATNKEGLTINFTFDVETGGGTIVSGKTEPPSEEDRNNEDVVVGTEWEWDSSAMGGLPDPGVPITAYSLVEGSAFTSFDKLSNPDQYIEKIKAAGYTVDETYSEEEGTYFYIASNEEGNQVSFTSSETGGSISFIKNE